MKASSITGTMEALRAASLICPTCPITALGTSTASTAEMETHSTKSGTRSVRTSPANCKSHRCRGGTVTGQYCRLCRLVRAQFSSNRNHPLYCAAHRAYLDSVQRREIAFQQYGFVERHLSPGNGHAIPPRFEERFTGPDSK